MTEKIVITKRQRALFLLVRLSDTLRNDILEDPAVAKQWNITLQRTIKAVDDFPMEWDTMFAAFRAAADGKPEPGLVDIKGSKLEAKVSIDVEGAALLETPTQRLRFVHAILMASDSAVRMSELEKIFVDKPLSVAEQTRLREIIVRPEFSSDEFMQVTEALAASPAEFSARLSEKANSRQVALSDLLPDNARHWSNLTAPRVSSDNLPAFIENELAAERKARLAINPLTGFRSIALTFSAPSLVAYDEIDALDVETRHKVLDSATGLEDHYSLIGAFELCARWVGQDDRFVVLGERLLDALFKDMKRLETACGIFGAAFVLALARLAEDETVNTQPAYWRRLAAASHALVVVRSCGVTEIDHNDLLKWAIGQSGQSYYVSLLSDFATDPQWRPEWVESRFLVADVCGRAIGTVLRMPAERIPASWKTRADAIGEWIEKEQYQLLMTFPAVMEGARRPNKPVLSQMEMLTKPYEQLIKEPTVDQLLLLTPAIHSFGFPPEALDSLYAVIASIRREPYKDGREFRDSALKLIAHISVLEQDVRLADAVAQACIERLAFIDERQPTHETVYRLIECAAADQDRERAMSTLARRLEQVANIVRDGAFLGELADLFEVLKIINSSMSQRLGRAIALAKLGAARNRAA
jgi:hypothetical protein